MSTTRGTSSSKARAGRATSSRPVRAASTPVPKRSEAPFTAQQLAAIELLANPAGDRTLGDIAKEVGVTERCLYGWRRDRPFADAVYNRAMEHLGGELPAILQALAARCKRGDPKAIALCLEHLGKYGPKVQLTGDMIVQLVAAPALVGHGNQADPS